jgi:mono/diheme cytochrome c family protein
VRRLGLPVALVALLFVLAGCSTSKPGEKVAKPLPDTVIGTVSTQAAAVVPAQYKHGDPTAGKQIFKTGPCAGCHTLKDAGTTGTVGPNLDQASPPLSLVVTRLLNGGGAMPSFKSQFSTKQIADVAAYVVKATGGNPNG